MPETEFQIIVDKIETIIGKYGSFEDRIKSHIKSEEFPLLYQALYKQIMPKDGIKFSSSEFKRHILKDKRYLKILNFVYSTRISDNGIETIYNTLNVNECKFDDYENTLKKFEGCYARKNCSKVSAFSFGTKVLHAFNPDENPILDGVIRKNLGINTKQLNLELCLNFKAAMNEFAASHLEFFDRIKSVFEAPESRLDPKCFPRMKVLDMALYRKT